MEKLQAILAGLGMAFDRVGHGPMALPLAFALGFLSALVSACCTLPVLTVIVGYVGVRPDHQLTQRLRTAAFFLAGSVLALVILGGVAAAVGQVAQQTLGRYWKVFAGFTAIALGLGSLNLLPFTIPKVAGPTNPDSRMGAFLFGLVGGGAVSVCSLACNPGIFIIVGTAVLQGVTLWLFGILLAYALGFALPLAALLLGASLGLASVRLKPLEQALRALAGLLLIAAGFYFLWTF